MSRLAQNYTCSFGQGLCNKPADDWWEDRHGFPEAMCNEHIDYVQREYREQLDRSAELHRVWALEEKWEKAFAFAAHDLPTYLARKAFGAQCGDRKIYVDDRDPEWPVEFKSKYQEV